MADEVNFDGLIGPTHHFAGLAFGNIASMTNKGRISNPKAAALQGLHKMQVVHALSIKQGILPPVCRPDFAVLSNLGFGDNRNAILNKLASQSTDFIAAFFSASSVWTANSATVSPSTDTFDRRVHITPANLTAKFHRALEATQTTAIFRAIFRDEQHFVVHDPLFANTAFGDEGAANHTRFCTSYEQPGLEFFVYGRQAFGKNTITSVRFPARQTLEASQAIARRHGLNADNIVYWQQNPHAIDAGAFHNDVVAVGNKDLLFCHADAFLHQQDAIVELQKRFLLTAKKPLSLLVVDGREVPLAEAVKSYLFNSQILSLPSGENLLLAPVECEESDSVQAYLKSVIGQTSLHVVQYVDLRESMLNGGGPACLRLRVVLNDEELRTINQGVLLSDALLEDLVRWANKHYRDQLRSEDLCDPQFVTEVETALDALTQILQLGAIYPFQI